MRACERAHAHARAWARGCVAGIKDQHPPTAWYRRHRSHHHQCLAQSAPVWEEICHRKPTPSASPPNPPVHHAEMCVGVFCMCACLAVKCIRVEMRRLQGRWCGSAKTGEVGKQKMARMQHLFHDKSWQATSCCVQIRVTGLNGLTSAQALRCASV